MSGLRSRQDRDHADLRLPMVLRMRALPYGAEAETG